MSEATVSERVSSPGGRRSIPTKPVALLLMTYGTPDTPEAVEPYLYNIFNDPDIIDLPWYAAPLRPLLARRISRSRATEVRRNYSRLEGGSPLLEQTEAQGEALARALRSDGDFRPFLGMRYWNPRTPDTLRRIVGQGLSDIVLVPMFPQYARATTGSALRDFKLAARHMGASDLNVRAVCCFPENEKMVQAMARAIRGVLDAIPESERVDTPLLFSAHGLPQSVVDKGDPYQSHVEQTVAAVVDRLGGHKRVTICYQSRVGKQEWLKPYTEDVISELIHNKVKRIVLYPVAFISEHSETLFELDLLYGDRIRAAGIEYHRVPALGLDPLFIDGLADEVRRALDSPPLLLK